MIGDFNAKPNLWSKMDKTIYESSQLEILPSKVSLLRIITEPTTILETSRSCINFYLPLNLTW